MNTDLAHVGLDIRPWVDHFERQSEGQSSGVRYGSDGIKTYVVDTVDRADVGKNAKAATIQMVTPMEKALQAAEADIKDQRQMKNTYKAQKRSKPQSATSSRKSNTKPNKRAKRQKDPFDV